MSQPDVVDLEILSRRAHSPKRESKSVGAVVRDDLPRDGLEIKGKKERGSQSSRGG